MTERNSTTLKAAIVIIAALLLVCIGYMIIDHSMADDHLKISPNSNLSYNGSEQNLISVSGAGYEVLFSVNGSPYSEEIPKAEYAGEYKVSYIVKDKNGEEAERGEFTIVIQKRQAVVTVISASKQYGDSDPAFTAKEEGVVTGDLLSYSITRDIGENIGTYPLHISGETNQGDYEIKFVEGTFTIERRVVTVSANDIVKVFESKDPALTASVSGLVGTDTIYYSISRDSGEDVGSYTIYVTGDTVQGNYIIQFHNGVFFIYMQTVTVTANNASKVFGDSDPKLTAVVSGGSNIRYNIYRDSGESTGQYKIHVTGDRLQGNYLVTYESADFFIMSTSSSWSTKPSVLNYTFDGYEHPLIEPGTSVGGTAYYRLSAGEYSTSIPYATEPGSYNIYYKVVGDGNHADTKESIITAVISEYVWNGTETKEPNKVNGKYQIYLASELAWISDNIDEYDGFSGTTIELKHDINLMGKEWSPIGTPANPFKGDFKGNEFTVSSLVVSSEKSFVGLFGYATGGSISDLTIDGSEIDGNEYVSALIGWQGCTVDNVYVLHSNIYGKRYVGGISGYQNAKISGCTVNYANITCERIDTSSPYQLTYLGNDAGGIVGMSKADISDCFASHLTITAYRDVGGIVGIIQESVGSLKISNCTVDQSTVIADIDGGNAGKIAGSISDTTTLSGNTANYVNVLYVSSQDQTPNENPNVFEESNTYDYIIVKADGTIVFSESSVTHSATDIHQITLDNITIEAAENTPAITVEPGAYVTIIIKNTVELIGGKNADAIRVGEGAQVTLTGSGTLKLTGNAGKEYFDMDGYRDKGTVDFKNTGGCGIGSTSGAECTIRVANLGALYTYGYGIHGYGIGSDNATLIISNSTIKEARGAFDAAEFSPSGDGYGTNDATGAPGIGGATIVINNSTIDLVKGGSKAAGIGCRYWCGTDITIVNSILKDVRGGNGSAGIGSSHSNHYRSDPTQPYDNKEVSIFIENSKINVTGGYYGAGIGSGYDKYTGKRGIAILTINITSYSEITAVGGKYAADIGTGYHAAVLYGIIDGTVIYNVNEGSEVKDKASYSYVAQDIGYGVVDYKEEASALMSGDTPVECDFTINGVPIKNPFNEERLEIVREKYPA